MTGFIRGLFGSKSKKVEEEIVESETKVGEYFLDADTAKSFGDIDYMRTAKAVRKSFPKTLDSKGDDLEIVEVVSSMQKDTFSGSQALGKSAAKSETTTEQPKPIKPEIKASKASNDTNLDMFRKMARDIKKP